MERDREKRRPEHTEGVRIIGAQEAADALERGDVVRRRPEDAPRFGDRPASPPEGGPRPAIRFPLGGAADPSDVDRPAVVPPDPVIRPSGGDVSMPHWTEPATGEVPRIFGGDEAEDDEDLDAWSTFASSSPRWRGEAPDHGADEFDDLSRLGDDETRIGALDDRHVDRDPHDFFAFDETDDEPEPLFEPATRTISSDPRRPRRMTVPGLPPAVGGGAGRDVPAAIGVGIGLGALFLILCYVGPWAVVGLATLVIVLAGAELCNGLRKAGFQPATLLGVTAIGSIVLAAYWKGEVAQPLVLFLTVVFGLLWYLLGVSDDRPVLNLSITLLAVLYVGLLGSFAALLLRGPDGIGLLLGAVIPTVGYDVGGFVVGRNAGRAPLTAVSPNKTWEGTAGGVVFAVVLGAFIGAFKLDPWTSLQDGLWLGIIVAAAALIGDLCESLMKRDLGVKDMGDILPGHGGILDRFDGMLFALPATYYLALVILQ